MSVNHLKNREAQRKYLTIAFGLWGVTGHLCWSKTSGSDVLVFNALGEGEWNACKGAYYRGEQISDFTFHPGALATGLLTGPQQVDSRFPLDVPHTRTATIGFKVPNGLADTDTAKNPPEKFKGIFETKKCPDFNNLGVQTDFSFSTNPAREIVELLKTYARLPNLPAAYASAAQYWLSRIDWGNWVDFRDYHNQLETVDYRTIPDLDGFGLTASYYSGTNFQTFVTKFVNANFDINYGSVPPAWGVAQGDFSAKFDGFIKFPKTETFTLYITADNGRRLTLNSNLLINQWLDNGQQTPGTNSATFNATANVFVPILAEWNDGGVTGNFKMEWESASVAREVIPSKYLYPKVEQQKLYEVHIKFETPTPVGAAIRQILFQCNSIQQEVNGKIRFYCLEQLAPSFTLDESKIESFKFRRRDILQSDPFTEYEAEFNDLDSQYLEAPKTPVSHKLDIFAKQSFENVKVVNLYNTTRWRARKVLQTRAKLETQNDLLADVVAPMAKSYPICAGDLINVQHRKLGAGTRICLVRKAVDQGIGEADGEIEKRSFVIQEW